MKPKDEQLRDPKWWDDNAPIDAEHLAIAPDATIIFYRQDSVGTWQIWGVRHKQWMFDGFSHDAGKPPYELTPRPTKPAAPEWDGEGKPPVGCEVECWDGEEWILGQSVGPYLGGWLCMLSTMERPFVGAEGDFRPLRTKEQRERDELVELMEAEREKCSPEAITAEQLSDAIIAAGWRKGDL